MSLAERESSQKHSLPTAGCAFFEKNAKPVKLFGTKGVFIDEGMAEREPGGLTHSALL